MSYIGDRTFAVFLQCDLHIGRGDVALHSAMFPNPRPSIAFIFLYDVQHLVLVHNQRAFIRA